MAAASPRWSPPPSLLLPRPEKDIRQSSYALRRVAALDMNVLARKVGGAGCEQGFHRAPRLPLKWHSPRAGVVNYPRATPSGSPTRSMWPRSPSCFRLSQWVTSTV